MSFEDEYSYLMEQNNERIEKHKKYAKLYLKIIIISSIILFTINYFYKLPEYILYAFYMFFAGLYIERQILDHVESVERRIDKIEFDHLKFIYNLEQNIINKIDKVHNRINDIETVT